HGPAAPAPRAPDLWAPPQVRRGRKRRHRPVAGRVAAGQPTRGPTRPRRRLSAVTRTGFGAVRIIQYACAAAHARVVGGARHPESARGATGAGILSARAAG